MTLILAAVGAVCLQFVTAAFIAKCIRAGRGPMGVNCVQKQHDNSLPFASRSLAAVRTTEDLAALAHETATAQRHASLAPGGCGTTRPSA